MLGVAVGDGEPEGDFPAVGEDVADADADAGADAGADLTTAGAGPRNPLVVLLSGRTMK